METLGVSDEQEGVDLCRHEGKKRMYDRLVDL